MLKNIREKLIILIPIMFIASLTIGGCDSSEQAISPDENSILAKKENPLIKKNRMLMATGKQRKFLNQEEIAEADEWLNIFSEHALGVIIGKFVSGTNSGYVENSIYTGGGYLVMDFHIIKQINLPQELPENIRVRYPIALIKIQEHKYREDIKNKINTELKASKEYQIKYKKGEVSESEHKEFNEKISSKIKPLQGIYDYVNRYDRGENFSLENDEFVLFIKKSSKDIEYYFHHNGIWPLRKGTFVDVLLLE